MQPYYRDALCTIYHGDYREIISGLPQSQVVITDPPYANGRTVRIRGRSLSKQRVQSYSMGMPWGYSLDWIKACGQPEHWVINANYKMLGALCTALPPSAIFIWWKRNAPNMICPMPRMDCEFIIWSRSKESTCEQMRDFRSMILNVPMLQAGFMAKERLTEQGGKAAHRCQKPLALVIPFLRRLGDKTYLDPFCGTGTTLVAAKAMRRRAIGIEREEKYCEMAAQRLAQGWLKL